MHRIALVIVFMLSTYLYGQNKWIPRFGFNVGLVASFGTHQNNLGLKLDSYIGNQYLQINAGVCTRYFFTGLGNRMKFLELRFAPGAVLMFGRPNNPINFTWGGSLNQSSASYSIGYALLWYYDRIGTTQLSGEWNLGIKRVDIRFENDVFGGQARDRFRTGSLLISYRDSLFKAGIGITIWTGDTRNSTWNKEARPGMPNGYRDITQNPFGKTSHGILFTEFDYHFFPNKYVGGRIGWDSEQVRHVFQNKISHDLVLFPKKMKRNTPHYPRLNAAGEVVFDKKSARKPKLYFQSYLNDGLLY